VTESSRELLEDLQASTPEVRIGLSRAGVRGISKAIRLRWGGAEKLIAAEIDCSVDLDPAQKGVHMSRFPELFEEAIDEVVISEAFLVEQLAEHIARHIVERQRAGRAEAGTPHAGDRSGDAGDGCADRDRGCVRARNAAPRGR
jgi:GTP cyclohydrolase FolE2